MRLVIANSSLENAIENTANQNIVKPLYIRHPTSHLPVKRRSYVALVVLTTVFPVAWCKFKIVERSLVIYNGMSHLSLNGLDIKPRAYTEKIQVTHGMFMVILERKGHRTKALHTW